MKKVLPWIGLLAFGILLGFLAHRWMPTAPAQPTPTQIVASMRSLGDLHTAEANLQWVTRHETSAEAPGWLAGVPMAQQVVQRATSNASLAKVSATVSAGVDLRQVKVTEVDGVVVATLPRAKSFRPHITLDIESERKSLLWQDRNLIPATQAQAEKDAVAAAQAMGLTKKAENEAVALVENLLKSVGVAKFLVQIDQKGVENPS